MIEISPLASVISKLRGKERVALFTNKVVPRGNVLVSNRAAFLYGIDLRNTSVDDVTSNCCLPFY
ncbi:hypothetical protein [Bavariicoccus seileri]|uniref:hypothetical protein n=1 Tax=Bavariicoccus seileri TaxID=549685 RepID=UPI003F8FFD71